MDNIRELARQKDVSKTIGTTVGDVVRSKRAQVVSAPIQSKEIDEISNYVRQIKTDVGMIHFSVGTILENTKSTLDSVKSMGEDISSIVTKLDDQSAMIKKIFKSLSEGSTGPGLGDIDLSLDKGKNAKSAKPMAKTAAKPPAGLLKGGVRAAGSLTKMIPYLGSALAGGLEYAESGDLGRAIASGIGAGLGMVIGGALGTAAGPVGTVLGGAAGSMAGEALMKSGYDLLFGKKNVESSAVKQTRQETAGSPGIWQTQYDKPLGTTATAPTRHETAESTPSYDDLSKIRPSAPPTGDLKSQFDEVARQAKAAGDPFDGVITAGQWALESGWGRSQIANSLNNEFGQTATSSEPGKVFAGNPLKFKAYETREQGRQEHVKRWAPKYSNASSIAEAIQLLVKSGYNSERGYASSLGQLIASMGIDINKPKDRSQDGSEQSQVAPSTPPPPVPSPAAPSAGGYQYPGKDRPEPAMSGAAPVTPPPPPGTSGGTQADTDKKPENVRLESGSVNLSGVDKDLLSNFYAAAKEYGRPVTIASAYRDDAYQAELWARGSLGERGIYTPARPKQAQRVTIKNGPFSGKVVDVPGGGGGSAHSDGKAIDTPEAMNPGFLSILQRHGLTTPLGGSDPVHVQKKGDSPGGSGGGGGRPTDTPAAGSMAQAAPQGRMAAPPGMSRAQYDPRGMSNPDMTSRSQVPGPIGIATGMPGLGQFAGILSALGAGAPRGMSGSVNSVGSLLGGIMGMMGGRQSQMNRAPNPTFAQDRYENNRVPSAMPSSVLLRELFDLHVSPGYNPVGYAFGR